MNGIIILLGAPNDDSGNLSSIATERCLEAMKLYKRHRKFGILPTGGFGEHFNRAANPHAHYTRNFLIEKGVPAEDVLEPALSRFTLKDASLSKPIVSRYSVENLIVVTSDFHLERDSFLSRHSKAMTYRLGVVKLICRERVSDSDKA